MKHTYCVKSEQRDREHNEDRGWAGALRLADGKTVQAAIVADGVGGQPYGEEVAQTVVATLQEAVCGATLADLEDEDRCDIWSSEWQRTLEERVQARYAGGFSTLCAAIWTGRTTLLFSVGDSPAFLVTNGTVERLFAPHTQAEEKLKSGVSEEEIKPAEYSRLVRAVGRRHPAGTPLADSRRMATRESGWLLLGSDGVFNHVGGSELRRTVEAAQRGGAAKIVRALLKISLANGRKKGGKLDNATLAVLEIRPGTPMGRGMTLQQLSAQRKPRRKLRVGRPVLYGLVALLVVLVAVSMQKLLRTDRPNIPVAGVPTKPEASSLPTNAPSISVEEGHPVCFVLKHKDGGEVLTNARVTIFYQEGFGRPIVRELGPGEEKCRVPNGSKIREIEVAGKRYVSRTPPPWLNGAWTYHMEPAEGNGPRPPKAPDPASVPGEKTVVPPEGGAASPGNGSAGKSFVCVMRLPSGEMVPSGSKVQIESNGVWSGDLEQLDPEKTAGEVCFLLPTDHFERVKVGNEMYGVEDIEPGQRKNTVRLKVSGDGEEKRGRDIGNASETPVETATEIRKKQGE